MRLAFKASIILVLSFFISCISSILSSISSGVILSQDCPPLTSILPNNHHIKPPAATAARTYGFTSNGRNFGPKAPNILKSPILVIIAFGRDFNPPFNPLTPKNEPIALPVRSPRTSAINPPPAAAPARPVPSAFPFPTSPPTFSAPLSLSRSLLDSAVSELSRMN